MRPPRISARSNEFKPLPDQAQSEQHHHRLQRWNETRRIPQHWFEQEQTTC